MRLTAIANTPSVYLVHGVPEGAHVGTVAARIRRYAEDLGVARKHNATEVVVRVRKGRKDRSRYYAQLTLT